MGVRRGRARNGWTLRGDKGDWGVDPLFMRPEIKSLGVLCGRGLLRARLHPANFFRAEHDLDLRKFAH